MKGPSGSGGHIIERGDPGHRFIRTKGEGGGGYEKGELAATASMSGALRQLTDYYCYY